MLPTNRDRKELGHFGRDSKARAIPLHHWDCFILGTRAWEPEALRIHTTTSRRESPLPGCPGYSATRRSGRLLAFSSHPRPCPIITMLETSRHLPRRTRLIRGILGVRQSHSKTLGAFTLRRG